MSDLMKARIFYVLTILFGGFGLAWTFFAEPAWYVQGAALVCMVASAVLGFNYTKPTPPTP